MPFLAPIFTGLFLEALLHPLLFSILATIGSSLVLSGVSRLLTKSPSAPSFAAQANSQQVTARQAIAPRTIRVGRSRVGGILTFITTTGANNDFVQMVITLAGHQVHAIPNMYFDGVLVPLDGSGNATGNFAGLVHAEFNLGSAGQSAFAGLVAAIPAQWTTAHKQSGRAGAYVQLKWDASKFPNGIPNITFDIQGAEVFDPRSSTTGYSENPALWIRNYLTNTSYGLGAATGDIDDASFISAANTCDELVPLLAGGNETRYTANGSFDMSLKPSDVLQSLLTSLAGDLVYVAGKWSLYAGVYIAPTVTLGDGDLRKAITVSTRISKRELANGVKGLYVSPTNNWQAADFPGVMRASYVADDNGFPNTAERGFWLTATAYALNDAVMSQGQAYVCSSAHTSGASTQPGVGVSWATVWTLMPEQIWKDINLPFTLSPSMSQRLAKIELNTIRRQVTASYPCKLSAYQVQPPNVVQVNRARYSWTNKTFKVTSSTLVTESDDLGAPALGVDLNLRETDANVFSWTAATDEQAATAPATPTLPSIALVQPITGLGLTSGAATSLTRVDGVRISRILAQWTAPADQMVLNGGDIVIEFRTHAGPGAWTPAGPCSGYATSFFIDGVNDGVAYDVRVFAENSAGTRSAAVEVDNHVVSGGFANFSGNLYGAQAGKNMLANPGFEFNTVGAAVNTDLALGAMICDNWTVYSLSAFHGAQLSTGASRTGTNALLSRLKQSVSVPSDGVFYENRNLSVAKISVAIGDIVRVSGQLRSDHSTVQPAGITFIHRVGLAIFDATDTWIGELYGELNPPAFLGAYGLVQASLQIPATIGGGVPSYVRVQCSGFVKNSSGSTFSTSTNAYADLRFDDVKVVVQNTAFDLTPLNTSGTPTTTNLCTQATTTTTINVAASSFQYGDGTVSYSSGSVNPGALGTWFIYADDPTYTGGAVVYQATANRSDISGNNGRIYFGMVTTVGGGGGASNNTGGTGGGKVGGL